MDLDGIVRLETLTTLSFAIYCLCIISAHWFAWRGNMKTAISLLVAVVGIPIILFVLAVIDNGGHGSGYNSLDLGMMIVGPMVVVASVVFALTCFGVHRLGNRKYNTQANGQGVGE